MIRAGARRMWACGRAAGSRSRGCRGEISRNAAMQDVVLLWSWYWGRTGCQSRPSFAIMRRALLQPQAERVISRVRSGGEYARLRCGRVVITVIDRGGRMTGICFDDRQTRSLAEAEDGRCRSHACASVPEILQRAGLRPAVLPPPVGSLQGSIPVLDTVATHSAESLMAVSASQETSTPSATSRAGHTMLWTGSTRGSLVLKIVSARST